MCTPLTDCDESVTHHNFKTGSDFSTKTRILFCFSILWFQTFSTSGPAMNGLCPKIRPSLLCLNESRLTESGCILLAARSPHVFFVLYTCHTHAAVTRCPSLLPPRYHTPPPPPPPSTTRHPLSHVSSAAARMPQPIPSSTEAEQPLEPRCHNAPPFVNPQYWHSIRHVARL
jgi:hypothetical protein